MNFTGSDWCGWCKLMDRNVFAHDEWKTAAAEKKWVLAYIDFPQNKSKVPDGFAQINKSLSDKYGVNGYPTYLILDNALENIGKAGASQTATPTSFIAQISTIIAKSTFSEDNLSPENLAAFKEAQAKLEEAKKEKNAWIETGPQRNEENMRIFKEFNDKKNSKKPKRRRTLGSKPDLNGTRKICG